MEIDFKDRILTADIEAVGLLWDIRKGHREDIHIIHCKDFETEERFTFFDDFENRVNPVWLDDYEDGFKAGSIADGVKALEQCCVLIMQNVSGFDALAIEKTFGSFQRNHFERRGPDKNLSYLFPYKTMDTAVMSRVLNPERPLPPQAYSMGIKLPGPHTIEAHGIRMGRKKPEHEDWSFLSPDMIHRCCEDVEIGEDFFKYLFQEWSEIKSRPNKVTGLDITYAYYNELRMAFAVARQEQRGFAVDVAYIAGLLEELDEKIDSTEAAFRPNMPKRIKKKKLKPEDAEKQVMKGVDSGHIKYDEALRFLQELEAQEYKVSYATTYWDLVTKKGEFLKNVTKYIPEARGFMQDHFKTIEEVNESGDVVLKKVFCPPVNGSFTPLVWEDIPLGNRDVVKQILYRYGWIGVNYNDTELEYIENNNGELPFPWSGKIDTDSVERWKKLKALAHGWVENEECAGEVDLYVREHNLIPEWCEGIADWYVLMSRRNQILNKKDPAYYDANGAWPRQTNGNYECRGLLANARNFDEGSAIEGMSATQYYEIHKHWPTEGHWRVPAKAFHTATNTHRMRHKVVVNIPSRGLYGKHMRRIFIAGPGKKVLGCDGAGLELRMLSHFMADPEYQEVILNGDIHTHNQNLAGLAKRDMAKVFVYAFLYGSGIPNLARQLGLSIEVVSKAVAKFKAELPKLTILLERVEKAASTFGYMLAVDGRWGRVRSKGGDILLHTALNVLLQMTGSLVMKWSAVRVEDECQRLGYIDSIDDFPMVAHVHDEAQMEVNADEVRYTEYQIHESDWKEDEKRVHIEEGKMWSAPVILEKYDEDMLLVQRMYHPIGEQYAKAIAWAGEFLKLRCPTAGEYKIGNNWSETH